jgi:hypothetical protein
LWLVGLSTTREWIYGARVLLANLGGNNTGDGVIGHLPKSYRAGEDFHYGLCLTTRTVARDNIGYLV